MSGVSSRILGTGAYLPARVVPNEELCAQLDTSPEWILERTGIRERRFAAADQTTSELAFRASEQALQNAGLTAQQLSAIVVGTVTPDSPTPACATRLQARLGCAPIPSFDLSAACAGFLFAYVVADQLIQSGLMQTVLVVGAELLSRSLDWKDRNTCILFGDGAGAVVLARDDSGASSTLATRWASDGTTGRLLGIAPPPLPTETPRSALTQGCTVFMEGRELFKHAVRHLVSAITDAVTSAGLQLHEVDWFVAHQANVRILQQVAERLGVPMTRFVVNIDRCGNTSSATIPLALHEALQDGRVQRGHHVVFCAVGAGLSWGALVLRY